MCWEALAQCVHEHVKYVWKWKRQEQERERIDSSFDDDGEEEGFWHERGQCVIMMALGVYSETDRRRLLYCATP